MNRLMANNESFRWVRMKEVKIHCETLETRVEQRRCTRSVTHHPFDQIGKWLSFRQPSFRRFANVIGSKTIKAIFCLKQLCLRISRSPTKLAENLKPETATFQRETPKNAKNHKKHKQILIATHKYFKKIN